MEVLLKNYISLQILKILDQGSDDPKRVAEQLYHLPEVSKVHLERIRTMLSYRPGPRLAQLISRQETKWKTFKKDL